MAISKVIVLDPHGEEKFNEHLSTADREIAIGEHNSDAQAHPAIQAELADKIDDIKVGGDSVVETVGGKRVVNFRKDQFGKVDGIAVNGTDVVLDEHGIADIQVPTTVEQLNDGTDYAKKTDLQSAISDMEGQIPQKVSDLTNDSEFQTSSQVDAKVAAAAVNEVNVAVDNTAPAGQPSAEITFQGGVLDITFKNVKGDTGEQGEQGIQGIQGVPGESAVFDPETGNISTLVHKTGDSIVNPMSQKGVTMEVERLDGRFEGVDKDIYHNSKEVDDETVYEDDYYKTGTPYNSAIAVSQMTAPSAERVVFNKVVFGPVNRRTGLDTDAINYRVCILASGDTLKVASGGTTIAEGTINLTTGYKQFEIELQEETILEVGEQVAVTIFRLGAATPKIQLAAAKNSVLAKFNDMTQKMYYVPYTGSSDTIIADMEAAETKDFTIGPSASEASTYYAASPILRLVRQSDLSKALEERIQTDIPSIVEDKVAEAKPSIVEEATEAAVQTLQGVRVWLPEKIYAVVGDTLQLFYRGIVEAPEPYNYAIFAQCSIGSSFKRYFEVTPTASQVGTKTLTVYVKNANGDIVGQASSQLIVKATPSSPQTQKKVLCLGSSTTVHGEWANELKRRLTNTNSVNGISGLGLSNVSVKYYGHAGWSWASYLSPATKQHRITVEGVSSVSVGATYTNNGNTYTVLEVNLTDGDGNILLGGSTVTPSAGGTLALASGSGDATITMLTVTVENENPLWDATNNKFSFVPWVTEQGGVDVLYVKLNVNGLNPWETFSMEDTTGRVANLKQAARTFHQEYPNAKIVFMTPKMPSLNGGMGSNYGATGMADDYGMAKSCFNLARLYKEFVNDEEFSSYVELADVTTQFDCEYNYPKTFRAANRRRQNSTAVTDVAEAYKVTRDSNGVHPENAGYYQIADAVYRHFVGVHL